MKAVIQYQNEAVGALIMLARRLLNLKQYELAHDINITRQTLSSIEMGKTTLSRPLASLIFLVLQNYSQDSTHAEHIPETIGNELLQDILKSLKEYAMIPSRSTIDDEFTSPFKKQLLPENNYMS